MRPLPETQVLKEAVENIIDSNKKDGYPPTRFIQATEGGTAVDLKVVCERLIIRGETLEYLERALTQSLQYDWVFLEVLYLNDATKRGSNRNGKKTPAMLDRGRISALSE